MNKKTIITITIVGILVIAGFNLVLKAEVGGKRCQRKKCQEPA